jgi:pyruvate,water dikinase
MSENASGFSSNFYGAILRMLLILGSLFVCIVPVDTSASKTPSYKYALLSKKDFDLFKGEPLSSQYNQVESVKVVYDIDDETFYYINSKHFQLHFGFCVGILGYAYGLSDFNDNNYSNTGERNYLLATLNYFSALDLYLVDFAVLDEISWEQVGIIYEQLCKSFYEPDKIRIFINTPYLEKLALQNKKLPVMKPEQVYGKQTYQTINKGRCYGYLRTFSESKGKNTPTDIYDILLVDGATNTLPLSAGVISSELQTPLSHITLLCKNRKTPFMSYKNALNDTRISSLIDSLVFLGIYKDSFTLRKASIEEANLFWAQKKRKKKIKLKIDTSIHNLVNLSDISYRYKRDVGAKAANLAELLCLKESGKFVFETPEQAFAIPFYFYFQHLQENRLDTTLSRILSSYQRNGDVKQLEESLNQFRRQIKKAPINPDLLRAVENRIRQSTRFSAFRFRSSTNAEDIYGFNGAGLYDSRTGKLDDEQKSIEKAIKKVWASAWNFRAFMEREYFNMDQQSVAMGILVHRSFPSEIANGVAITRNLYRRYEFGFVINVQKDEYSVVSPAPDIVCDQLICYGNQPSDKYTEDNAIEYISYSNINKNKGVLTSEQIIRLTRDLEKIKSHFYYKTKMSRYIQYIDYALDVEFKYEINDVGDTVLYIKQVRPFY